MKIRYLLIIKGILFLYMIIKTSLIKRKYQFPFVYSFFLCRNDFGIRLTQSKNRYDIPITQFACLLLGPGVSITHDAMTVIANSGTTVIWCKQK